MRGLMQSSPLMISGILHHAEVAHPDREIVSRVTDGSMWSYDYSAFAERVRRCANMQRDIGVRPGDRVRSLAWNTSHPMELFFAVRLDGRRAGNEGVGTGDIRWKRSI